MRWTIQTLALMLALAVPGVALAQSEEIIRDTAGTYRILPVDGRPGCGIRLTTEPTIGGRLAVPDATCAKRVPQSAGINAWALLDGVRFYDAMRRPKMRFEEDETTLLRSPSIMHPLYYLMPGGPELTRAPTKANVVGRWLLSRPGRPDCAVELIGSAAAARDNHPLKLGAGCAGARLPKGLLYWRLEELTLLLEGPNDAALQLETDGDDRFVGADAPWRLHRPVR